ncbi:MAG: D-alanyl-D-alanine carboxypeptidase family protein [Clostridia bacterium]|nr:D-alanyl-D-alanine carboxypeptidase family protein [Clostridia bacterium]
MAGSPKRPVPVKTVAVMALLAAAAVLLVLLAVRTFGLVPQVVRERNATPTPAPFYGNVMVTTPDPSAPTPAPALRNGSRGEEVIRLQQRLQELGYYQGSIDGQFGGGTEEAVMRFQQAAGLAADGLAGEATCAVLYSDAAPSALPTPTPVPTPSPTPVPGGSAKGYIRPDGLPLVVNRKQPLPEGYRQYDLVEMNSYCDSAVVKIKYADTWAEREAVDALMVMLRAAEAEGIGNWQISAAYRDVAYQQRLMDNKVKDLMKSNGLSAAKAKQAAKNTVADPGTSEHHLGVCFDITVPGKSFSGTKQYKWISAHCWEYGFILRYTKEKRSITGFSAEAWHYRWVGQPHAEIMHRENLCLEEYVEKYGTP